MKINIVIESSNIFDADQFIDWLNDELSMGNMGTDADTVATGYTIIEE
jgi:hypothetical protein